MVIPLNDDVNWNSSTFTSQHESNSNVPTRVIPPPPIRARLSPSTQQKQQQMNVSPARNSPSPTRITPPLMTLSPLPIWVRNNNLTPNAYQSNLRQTTIPPTQPPPYPPPLIAVPHMPHMPNIQIASITDHPEIQYRSSGGSGGGGGSSSRCIHTGPFRRYNNSMLNGNNAVYNNRPPPAYAPHEHLWYRQQNNQELHRRHMSVDARRRLIDVCVLIKNIHIKNAEELVKFFLFIHSNILNRNGLEYHYVMILIVIQHNQWI